MRDYHTLAQTLYRLSYEGSGLLNASWINPSILSGCLKSHHSIPSLSHHWEQVVFEVLQILFWCRWKTTSILAIGCCCLMKQSFFLPAASRRPLVSMYHPSLIVQSGQYLLFSGGVTKGRTLVSQPRVYPFTIQRLLKLVSNLDRCFLFGYFFFVTLFFFSIVFWWLPDLVSFSPNPQ